MESEKSIHGIGDPFSVNFTKLSWFGYDARTLVSSILFGITHVSNWFGPNQSIGPYWHKVFSNTLSLEGYSMDFQKLLSIYCAL